MAVSRHTVPSLPALVASLQDMAASQSSRRPRDRILMNCRRKNRVRLPDQPLDLLAQQDQTASHAASNDYYGAQTEHQMESRVEAFVVITFFNSFLLPAALPIAAMPMAFAEQAAPETLFVARPLTDENSFTSGIEGPACDAAGNLFVVNLKRTGDIGRVTPDGKTEVFIELPEKSAGNGIVFDKQGSMYVADYAAHNVLKVEPQSKKIEALVHEPAMNQPNDLAIAPDGTLYASDPNWATGGGQIWKITRDGKATRVAAGMGTTNGIEVSPDGKMLYVNESVQRNIWAFPINADGKLGEKRLLKKFDDHGFDGMRSDIDGNLYIARHGKGTVVKLSPTGEVLREIDVLGKSPTNLCFGGPDGRTVFVTEVDHRRVITFRTDRPGAAPMQLRQAGQ